MFNKLFTMIIIFSLSFSMNENLTDQQKEEVRNKVVEEFAKKIFASAMEAKRAMMVEQTREQSLLDNFATTAPRDQFIFNADIDSSLAYGIESATVYASTDNQNSWVSAPAAALNTEGYENTWEGEVFTGDGNSVYSYLAGEVNSEVLGEEFGTILVSSSPHNINGSWPVSDNLYARLATDATGDAPASQDIVQISGTYKGDIAFDADGDEYTDVEKITSSIITTNARQYYVERTLLRSSVPDVEEPPADSSPGFATWTSSGAYTGHMPFIPGSGYAAGPYSGSFTIKYIPSTNTWEISGSIPATGGWGGNFSGSAIYDACSGSSAANVDITITGTHYCTATSQNETYSGTVRLNISSGNSSDESTCSSDITINSVSFGATQYSSSGGCYITYAHSSISYNGYTDPVVGSTDSKAVFESKVKRRIGSLAARLTNSELNILQEHAFIQDEDSELLVNPTEADFSNVYIKIKSKIKNNIWRIS